MGATCCSTDGNWDPTRRSSQTRETDKQALLAGTSIECSRVDSSESDSDESSESSSRSLGETVSQASTTVTNDIQTSIAGEEDHIVMIPAAVSSATSSSMSSLASPSPTSSGGALTNSTSLECDPGSSTDRESIINEDESLRFEDTVIEIDDDRGTLKGLHKSINGLSSGFSRPKVGGARSAPVRSPLGTIDSETDVDFATDNDESSSESSSYSSDSEEMTEADRIKKERLKRLIKLRERNKTRGRSDTPTPHGGGAKIKEIEVFKPSSQTDGSMSRTARLRLAKHGGAQSTQTTLTSVVSTLNSNPFAPYQREVCELRDLQPDLNKMDSIVCDFIDYLEEHKEGTSQHLDGKRVPFGRYFRNGLLSSLMDAWDYAQKVLESSGLLGSDLAPEPSPQVGRLGSSASSASSTMTAATSTPSSVVATPEVSAVVSPVAAPQRRSSRHLLLSSDMADSADPYDCDEDRLDSAGWLISSIVICFNTLLHRRETLRFISGHGIDVSEGGSRFCRALLTTIEGSEYEEHTHYVFDSCVDDTNMEIGQSEPCPHIMSSLELVYELAKIDESPMASSSFTVGISSSHRDASSIRGRKGSQSARNSLTSRDLAKTTKGTSSAAMGRKTGQSQAAIAECLQVLMSHGLCDSLLGCLKRHCTVPLIAVKTVRVFKQVVRASVAIQSTRHTSGSRTPKPKKSVSHTEGSITDSPLFGASTGSGWFSAGGTPGTSGSGTMSSLGMGDHAAESFENLCNALESPRWVEMSMHISEMLTEVTTGTRSTRAAATTSASSGVTSAGTTRIDLNRIGSRSERRTPQKKATDHITKGLSVASIFANGGKLPESLHLRTSVLEQYFFSIFGGGVSAGGTSIMGGSTPVPSIDGSVGFSDVFRRKSRKNTLTNVESSTLSTTDMMSPTLSVDKEMSPSSRLAALKQKSAFFDEEPDHLPQPSVPEDQCVDSDNDSVIATKKSADGTQAAKEGIVYVTSASPAASSITSLDSLTTPMVTVTGGYHSLPDVSYDNDEAEEKRVSLHEPVPLEMDYLGPAVSPPPPQPAKPSKRQRKKRNFQLVGTGLQDLENEQMKKLKRKRDLVDPSPKSGSDGFLTVNTGTRKSITDLDIDTPPMTVTPDSIGADGSGSGSAGTSGSNSTAYYDGGQSSATVIEDDDGNDIAAMSGDVSSLLAEMTHTPSSVSLVSLGSGTGSTPGSRRGSVIVKALDTDGEDDAAEQRILETMTMDMDTSVLDSKLYASAVREAEMETSELFERYFLTADSSSSDEDCAHDSGAEKEKNSVKERPEIATTLSGGGMVMLSATSSSMGSLSNSSSVSSVSSAEAGRRAALMIAESEKKKATPISPDGMEMRSTSASSETSTVVLKDDESFQPDLSVAGATTIGSAGAGGLSGPPSSTKKLSSGLIPLKPAALTPVVSQVSAQPAKVPMDLTGLLPFSMSQNQVHNLNARRKGLGECLSLYISCVYSCLFELALCANRAKVVLRKKHGKSTPGHSSSTPHSMTFITRTIGSGSGSVGAAVGSGELLEIELDGSILSPPHSTRVTDAAHDSSGSGLFSHSASLDITQSSEPGIRDPLDLVFGGVCHANLMKILLEYRLFQFDGEGSSEWYSPLSQAVCSYWSAILLSANESLKSEDMALLLGAVRHTPSPPPHTVSGGPSSSSSSSSSISSSLSGLNKQTSVVSQHQVQSSSILAERLVNWKSGSIDYLTLIVSLMETNQSEPRLISSLLQVLKGVCSQGSEWSFDLLEPELFDIVMAVCEPYWKPDSNIDAQRSFFSFLKPLGVSYPFDLIEHDVMQNVIHILEECSIVCFDDENDEMDEEEEKDASASAAVSPAYGGDDTPLLEESEVFDAKSPSHLGIHASDSRSGSFSSFDGVGHSTSPTHSASPSADIIPVAGRGTSSKKTPRLARKKTTESYLSRSHHKLLSSLAGGSSAKSMAAAAATEMLMIKHRRQRLIKHIKCGNKLWMIRARFAVSMVSSFARIGQGLMNHKQVAEELVYEFVPEYITDCMSRVTYSASFLKACFEALSELVCSPGAAQILTNSPITPSHGFGAAAFGGGRPGVPNPSPATGTAADTRPGLATLSSGDKALGSMEPSDLPRAGNGRKQEILPDIIDVLKYCIDTDESSLVRSGLSLLSKFSGLPHVNVDVAHYSWQMIEDYIMDGSVDSFTALTIADLIFELWNDLDSFNVIMSDFSRASITEGKSETASSKRNPMVPLISLMNQNMGSVSLVSRLCQCLSIRSRHELVESGLRLNKAAVKRVIGSVRLQHSTETMIVKHSAQILSVF